MSRPAARVKYLDHARREASGNRKWSTNRLEDEEMLTGLVEPTPPLLERSKSVRWFPDTASGHNFFEASEAWHGSASSGRYTLRACEPVPRNADSAQLR